MKIEDQVCSLDQGKRLLELGIIVQPQFYYAETKEYKKGKGFVSQGLVLGYYGRDAMFIDTENYPAYTVAELGMMLQTGHYTIPSKITTSNDLEFIGRRTWHAAKGYEEVEYFDLDDNNDHFYNEARCRAAMLIHLLETNLTTAEEANKV